MEQECGTNQAVQCSCPCRHKPGPPSTGNPCGNESTKPPGSPSTGTPCPGNQSMKPPGTWSPSTGTPCPGNQSMKPPGTWSPSTGTPPSESTCTHTPPCRPQQRPGSAYPDNGSSGGPDHNPAWSTASGSICSSRPPCNCVSPQPETPNPNKTTAPVFYTIESVSHPGYFVTQQGTQLILSSRDVMNPFQLWYRDDSWSFIGIAYVFINHGSKKALKSQLSGTSASTLYKATVGVYDPSVHDDSIIWSYNGNEKEPTIILHAHKQVHLSHGCSSSGISDGVPVITSKLAPVHEKWRVTVYEPTTMYKIQCQWFTNQLSSKERLVDFTAAGAPATHNDEHNVVGIHPNNKLDGMIWYKVPAGGKQDTTFGSSFIIINKSTGFALKGSSKSGDKVILTKYDPLDYNFVWSENRHSLNNGQQANYTVINLDGTNLQWCFGLDGDYQNGVWYHILSLQPAPANNYLDRQTWAFIKN